MHTRDGSPPTGRCSGPDRLGSFALRNLPDDGGAPATGRPALTARDRSSAAAVFAAWLAKTMVVCQRNAGDARTAPCEGRNSICPGPDGPDCPVHVAAGPPVDALAIAAWRRRQAWAAVGAGELVALAPALPTAGREIVIEANGVGPAKEAAARLQSAPHRYGARTRLIHWPG